MFTPTPLHDQLTSCRSDPLRVLVVGAGIAGTTAAGLLRTRGLHPVLIGRAASMDDAGYMLALMPMVDAAIDELGVRSEYLRRSTHVETYRLLGPRGATLREDGLGAVLSTYGDYRGISRGELLGVLTDGGTPVTTATTMTALADDDAGAHATLATPSGDLEATFDLVIIADGIHSRTRELIPGGRTPDRTDTDWGGWVVWADEDGDTELVEEAWGRDFFVGSYPVAGAIGIFIGGRRADTSAGPQAFVRHIRAQLTTGTPRLRRVLAGLEAADDPFYWALDDVRTSAWTHGRTVLLGDAAAGFLPTAGIGAGMAIESAWMLCQTIADTGPLDVNARLMAYEAAQRRRVESAHENSRQLARLMFRRGAMFTHIRTLAMRVTSIKVALRPIIKLLRHPALPPHRGEA